jgi:hypothetical protein
MSVSLPSQFLLGANMPQYFVVLLFAGPTVLSMLSCVYFQTRSDAEGRIYIEADRERNGAYISIFARAIAEAVSRWLPTAAARVRARVWQVGFVVDKMASGQVFSEHFGFPLQNEFVPPISPSSSSSSSPKYKRKIEVPPIGKSLMSRHLRSKGF